MDGVVCERLELVKFDICGVCDCSNCSHARMVGMFNCFEFAFTHSPD